MARIYGIVEAAVSHKLSTPNNQPIPTVLLFFCCRRLVLQVVDCFGDIVAVLFVVVCVVFAQKNTKLDKIVKMLIYLFCLLSSEACLL